MSAPSSWRVLAAVLAALVLGMSPARAAGGDPIVVLVSIDGFRWDYLELHPAPRLRALADRGVRAEGLVPVFPTKTFPNHYTLVTGLWPENHGIVGNNMFDPEFDAAFRLGDPDSMTNGRWWGGEPLWVTAERQGVRTATMFWVGSEAEIGGVRPTHWVPYDSALPGRERVERVLGWLDRSERNRPRFLTLYFSLVDSAGHAHGPDSPEVARAVAEVDADLGALVDGIAARGLDDRVELVVVSDHGMAALDHDRVIVIDDHVELDRDEVATLSPLLGVWPRRADPAELVRALDEVPHLRAWRREDLPERFHLRDHRRTPPVLALADEGWRVLFRDDLERFRDRPAGGGHGFDPRLASMRGLFVAAGPSFESGRVVPPFESVHVYSLLAHLLGIEPAPGDGTLTAVEQVLVPARR